MVFLILSAGANRQLDSVVDRAVQIRRGGRLRRNRVNHCLLLCDIRLVGPDRDDLVPRTTGQAALDVQAGLAQRGLDLIDGHGGRRRELQRAHECSDAHLHGTARRVDRLAQTPRGRLATSQNLHANTPLVEISCQPGYDPCLIRHSGVHPSRLRHRRRRLCFGALPISERLDPALQLRALRTLRLTRGEYLGQHRTRLDDTLLDARELRGTALYLGLMLPERLASSRLGLDGRREPPIERLRDPPVRQLALALAARHLRRHTLEFLLGLDSASALELQLRGRLLALVRDRRDLGVARRDLAVLALQRLARSLDSDYVLVELLLERRALAGAALGVLARSPAVRGAL